MRDGQRKCRHCGHRIKGRANDNEMTRATKESNSTSNLKIRKIIPFGIAFLSLFYLLLFSFWLGTLTLRGSI